MHLDLWYLEQQRAVLAWWASLGADGPYYLWIAVGILGLALWAVGGYYLLRYLAGHRKHYGTWYKPHEFQALLQGILEDQRSGHRVLSPAELALIRKHLGVKTMFSLKGGGYFDG